MTKEYVGIHPHRRRSVTTQAPTEGAWACSPPLLPARWAVSSTAHRWIGACDARPHLYEGGRQPCLDSHQIEVDAMGPGFAGSQDLLRPPGWPPRHRHRGRPVGAGPLYLGRRDLPSRVQGAGPALLSGLKLPPHRGQPVMDQGLQGQGGPGNEAPACPLLHGLERAATPPRRRPRAGLLTRLVGRGWLWPSTTSRAVQVAGQGGHGLADTLGLARHLDAGCIVVGIAALPGVPARVPDRGGPSTGARR